MSYVEPDVLSLRADWLCHCFVQGNLSEFVKRVPEAQAYYNLEAASTKFAFPEPGFLEGIKTKDKAILKMARVGFT